MSTPWAGCAPTTPLTPKQRLKLATVIRRTLEEAHFHGAVQVDAPIEDRDNLRTAWAASTIAETIAEQQFRNWQTACSIMSVGAA